MSDQYYIWPDILTGHPNRIIITTATGERYSPIVAQGKKPELSVKTDNGGDGS